MPLHDEEDLVENVVSLRDQLRRTEISLQTLGNQLSCTEYSGCPQPELPAALTIEDLQQADVAKPPSGGPSPARNSVTMANSRAASAREMELENCQLKRQHHSVQEKNSALVLENQQLVQQLEALRSELASSRTKIHLLGSTVGSKTSSLSVMKEQILDLSAEVEQHSSAFRETERKLQESQRAVAMGNRHVTELKVELREVRAVLAERSAQGRRAEQQRNSALHNAEKLTAAFEEYKAKAGERLRKVLEEEGKLKESLVRCDKEREELESRCGGLLQEQGVLEQEIRQLRVELQKEQEVSKEAEAARRLLQEREAEAARRLLQEREEATVRQVEALKQENAELRSASSQQEQRLAQCRREAEESRAELTGLEAILGLLHLQEGGGTPCVKPCMLPACSILTGPVSLLNPKPGDGYQKLLSALQTLEQEKARQAGLASATQAKLDEAQREIAALQDSMSQRASHFQRLHSEMLEKASAAGRLERELKKKGERLDKMQDQLQEKSSAYSQAAVKIGHLEQSLQEQTSRAEHLRSLLDRKQRDFQQQRKNLESQVELLSLDQKQAVVLELERAAASARQERRDAQQKAQALQLSLDRLSEEKEQAARRTEDTLRAFREQAAQSCAEVKGLEEALAVCKEELSTYVRQMEEAKEQLGKQLEKKNSEVVALHAQLEDSALASRSSSEHNVQLQCSLQRQQTMLQESAARVVELEECQAQLESQVGRLEQELLRERAAGAQQLQRSEQMVQEATEEALRKGQQAAALSISVTQLTGEMSTCRNGLSDLETELLQLRRDSGIKASQLNQMEETLQETQGQLEKKSEMVVDLEEKLHRSEMDRRNSLQRTQLLETQLRTVRGELADTLCHLQELHTVLQRTQLDAEEREAAMERLAAELRDSRKELEERSHEVLDMDVALKERQGELKERALQLSQLDVAIRDHRLDMEKKVLHLQGALEKSQEVVMEREKQVELLSRRLDLVRKQLQDKEELEKELQEARSCCEALQRELQEAQSPFEGLERELQEARSRCEALQREVQEARSPFEGLERELQEARSRCEALQREVQEARSPFEGLERELQEARSRCEALQREVEDSVTLVHQKDVQARQLGQDLAASQAHASELETQLGAAITRLEKELEMQREEHRTELSAVELSRTQLLKVSEHISSSLRLSQEQLVQRLQQVTSCLEEARGAQSHLQAELQAREDLLRGANEALLVKESEVTRLQTRLSSYERTAELKSASLLCDSVLQPPSSYDHKEAPCPGSWEDSDSLGLPESLRDALHGTLEPLEQSWRGLSQRESSCSELSFNPLTYMAEENEDGAIDVSGPGSPAEPNMDTFTGMLNFISRQLALQGETDPIVADPPPKA
ncbi:coiled-coil domain-containing protein 18 isoform X2 [Brienomyrus brachyistius]|uniref:coiled-coil domain-containing protein 18 isoform X2 n=1 Tax=Brienomyrus brachyistius TaxID=42636 RepID=UPI0020B38971|nr:coiled-coil domain-containing protein 18 isoform X2 [Brienomyrus brachyistius]